MNQDTKLFRIMVLLAISFMVLFSVVQCSAEEDTSPPPSIVITPKPEPEPTPAPTQYTLTVTAGEGGTVSSSGGTYDEGTSVTITANPNEGYVFNGWDNNSLQNPIIFQVNENSQLSAKYISLIEYFSEIQCGIETLVTETLPNSTTDNINNQFIPFNIYNKYVRDNIHVEINGNPYQNYDSQNFLYTQIFSKYIDINKNSIPDLFLVGTNHLSEQSGEFFIIVDNELIETFNSTQTGNRKLLKGDLDNNGYDDIVSIATGIDTQPYSGSKTQIIYFNENGFEQIRLDEDPSYYHTGAIGDVNNDGKLDIIVINSQGPEDTFIYINEGDKRFSKKILKSHPFFANIFNCSLYDLNSDGNLDLITGGHEWTGFWQDEVDPKIPYLNTIFYGNGDGSFDFDNPTHLPDIEFWGIVNDFIFYDIENDGIPEIFICRATGHKDYETVQDNVGYDGLKIQILKKEGNQYINHQILDQPEEWFTTPYWFEWVANIEFFDVNRDCFIDIVPDRGVALPVPNEDIFYGIYYKGNSDGYFELDYFDPDHPLD